MVGADASFPARVISATRQHLVDLLHSLNTLHLQNVFVNWDLMGCQNLVPLSLASLNITIESIQEILSANPRLQHIYLTALKINESSTATSSLPSIQLNQLRTLELFCSSSTQWARLLAMIVPGSHGLNLLIHPYFSGRLSDASKHAYFEFCRQFPIERLSCFSLASLVDIATVITRLEALTFRGITIPDELYDFFVPKIDNNTHSPSLRFPNMHTIHIIDCIIESLKDLRRICSAYRIRNIGSGEIALSTSNGGIFSLNEFRDRIGSEVNVTIVPQNPVMGHMPFGLY